MLHKGIFMYCILSGVLFTNSFALFDVRPTAPSTAAVVTRKATTKSISLKAGALFSTPTTNAKTTRINPIVDEDRFCQVGHNAPYTNQQCDPSTPYCMNTIVVTEDFTLVKKSCETAILCLREWVYGTSRLRDCLKTDFNKLVPVGPGLVCHYCCNSKNGSICNTDDIPKEAQIYIANKVIDGGWSMWSVWNGCTSNCGGVQVRIRTCSRPYPAIFGTPCQGEGFQERNCDKTNCPVPSSGPNLIG